MDSAPPWTALYPPGVPTYIEPRWTNASELFEHAYRAAPGEPGVHYFDTTLSFGELGRRAHAFAAALTAEFGIRPGDRVAVMLQNVPAVPVVLHGAFLAGAVVAPVSAMLQPDELAHHLASTGARLVVTLESLYPTVTAALPGSAVEHVLVTSELEDLSTVPSSLAGSKRLHCPSALALREVIATHAGRDVIAHRAEPDDPALLAYTSGTTGVAKAAVVSHGALIRAAESLRVWADLQPGQTTIAAAPMFHITGLTGHLATSRAACSPLLLMYRFEAGELLRLVEKWQGSWMLGPSTAYLALMRHPDFATRDLTSLRTLHSGGAPLPTAALEAFESASGRYLYNVYGLTETATPCHGVPRGSRAPVDPETGAVSIGVPLPGVLAKVVTTDEHGESIEAAPGELGELAIHSPTLASGYWQRPDETALAFHDGWFHTGDLAKRDEAGYFYVVDRIKDMVIVSGFKVSPRDVEEVLLRHPAVRDAAVIGVPDDYRGEVVKAFLVVAEDATPDPDEVRAFCRARLAPYKVPGPVDFLSAIPRNPSGKILKRSLREHPISPTLPRSTS